MKHLLKACTVKSVTKGQANMFLLLIHAYNFGIIPKNFQKCNFIGETCIYMPLVQTPDNSNDHLTIKNIL